MDSGATHHVTSNLGNLHLQSPYSGTSRLIVGNGASVNIENTGTMHVSSLQHNKVVVLRNVLHVPDITRNLLSISQFLKDNAACIKFHATYLFF